LSDERLEFTEVLNLPTFEAEGKTLVRRLTMIVESGKILKVFYPVFPPGRNAEEVIGWLSERSAS
jgi:peroxiredoxin